MQTSVNIRWNRAQKEKRKRKKRGSKMWRGSRGGITKIKNNKNKNKRQKKEEKKNYYYFFLIINKILLGYQVDAT